MQQQHPREQYNEDLNQMTQRMRKVGEQKVRAFDEQRETTVKVDEAIATKRKSEPKNHSVSNTKEQHKTATKDNNMESSKPESNKTLELQLAEKDALLEKFRKEEESLGSSESNAMTLNSDYKRKIQELEAELDKRKESEANLFDTLVMQTKQLEQNKILLEESKLEISSLEEKIKAIQGSASKTVKSPNEPRDGSENGISAKENVKGMKSEDDLPRKNLNGEGPSMKVENLLEELNSLKTELKSATEAEENSKKAMDDLAFALKEVATEANQVKAKLTLSQVELEHSKGEAERWRAMLESTEEKYKELLDATRKEADRYKNTAERLRLEAEESLNAWNGKETEFVNCIRRAEEERLVAQKESNKVLEMLKEADNKTKVSKEENQKLRDILKQALNEANVAKEAAEIAKAENARLQDSLNLLVHENEMLKIHEAASFENIRELKRMLSESSSKELKFEEIEKGKEKEKEKEKAPTKEIASKDENKESVKKAKGHSNNNSAEKEHNKESKNLTKTFSFNLKDMITPHKQHKVGNEEPANKETDDDTLKGSIFDEVDDSSDSESRHDAEMAIPDDFVDHLDESHFDDPENDKNSRKRRALLRRFGDLIRRRSYHNNNNNNHRKESSTTEEQLQT